MREIIIVADLVDPKDKEGRTYREINNATKHQYEVGQLIEIKNGVRMFIAKQTRDCDGTPLYSLTAEREIDEALFNERLWLHGYDEESMRLITPPDNKPLPDAPGDKV
jgi:hypothetical protein